MAQSNSQEQEDNPATKTDKYAKYAFCMYLRTNGYKDVRIINSPVDIKAKMDKKTWWFEIKKTGKDKYFGATTLTELEKASQCKNSRLENFRFVIAKEKKISENSYTYNFTVLTLEEFLSKEDFNPSIPPFKVYFNVDLKSYKKGKSLSDYHCEFKEATYNEFRKPDEEDENSTKKNTVFFNEKHIGELSEFMNHLRNRQDKKQYYITN